MSSSTIFIVFLFTLKSLIHLKFIVVHHLFFIYCVCQAWCSRAKVVNIIDSRAQEILTAELHCAPRTVLSTDAERLSTDHSSGSCNVERK